MELNSGKFEYLNYRCGSHPPNCRIYWSNTATVIEEKDNVRDLGVIVSNDCTFKAHIQSLITEARKQSAWVLRTFATRECLPMLTLWKSLILCKLDYCSQLWSPIDKGDIQSVEMIQRSFIQKI